MVFKVYEIQNLLTAAYQKKYADEIINDLKIRIALLNENIKQYEIIIKNFVGKDTLNNDIKLLFASKVEDMKKQRAIFEAAILDYKKEAKKWRRKVRWISITGIVAVGISAYLYIKK